MNCDENYAPVEIKDEVQKVERCLILQREFDITTIMVGIDTLPQLKYDYQMSKLDYIGEFAFDLGRVELACDYCVTHLLVGCVLALGMVFIEKS